MMMEESGNLSPSGKGTPGTINNMIEKTESPSPNGEARVDTITNNEDQVPVTRQRRARTRRGVLNSMSKRFSMMTTVRNALKAQEEAAILIQHAIDAEAATGLQLDTSSRDCFKKRRKYQFFFLLAAWSIIITHVLERPAWTYTVSNWQDRDAYPSFGIKYVPHELSTILVGIAVVILVYAVKLEYAYVPKMSLRWYLLHALSFLLFFELCFALISIVKLCLHSNPLPFTASPAGPLIVVLVERRFGSNMVYLLRTIPRFSFMVIILFAVVMAYTSLGFMIFNPDYPEAQQYFDTFGKGVWNMLMTLNGSNWPTPFMPAYCQNRLSIVYFIVYIVIVNWGLLNLVLGLIVSTFRTEQLSIADLRMRTKVENLKLAFKTMDVNKKGYLSYAQMDLLLVEYFESYISLTKGPTKEEILRLIVNLGESGISMEDIDIDDVMEYGDRIRSCHRDTFTKFDVRAVEDATAAGQGRITEEQFLQLESRCLVDTLKMIRALPREMQTVEEDEFANEIDSERKSNANELQSIDITNDSSNKNSSSSSSSSDKHISKKRLNSIFSLDNPTVSMVMKTAIDTIDTPFFDISVDMFINFWGLLFCLQDDSSVAAMCFIIFSIVEICLKLFAKGLFRYRSSYRNVADAIITITCFISFLYHAFKHSFDAVHHFNVGVRASILVRLTLLPRNILVLPSFSNLRRQYRSALQHVFLGVGDFLFLLVILFAFMYTFASFGVNVFGGVITTEGPVADLIIPSAYGVSKYWPLNFNDMPSAIITMFILLSVNNMHVIASGFTSATSSQTPLLFFALWYAIGVLLLLNVVTAFVLNEFISYLEKLHKERQRLENENTSSHPLENKIKDNNNNNNNDETDKTDNVRQFRVVSSIFRDKLNPITIHSKNVPLPLNVDSQGSKTRPISTRSVLPYHTESLLMNDTFKQKENDVAAVEDKVASADRQLSHKGMSQSVSQISSMIKDGFLNVGRTLSGLGEEYTISAPSSLVSGLCSQSPLQPYELAAIFMQFAREEKAHVNFPATPTALWCFRWRRNVATYLKGASWLLLLLRVFERPLWTFSSSCAWDDNAIYPRYGIPLLNVAASSILKMLVIAVLLAGLILEYWGARNGTMWQVEDNNLNHANLTSKLRILLIIFACIQMVILFICFLGSLAESPSSPLSLSFGKAANLSTVGSLIYIFWFNNKAANKVRLLFRVIPRFSLLLLVFFIFIMVFAAYGPFIFNLQKVHSDDVANQLYFNTYGDALWSVFVAITSSCYPNQIMPGYRDHREFFFYFVPFIFMGQFGMLNLILVFVFIDFNKANKEKADVLKSTRKVLLYHAFSALDTAGVGFVSKDKIRLLLKEIFTYYTDFHKLFGVPSHTKQELLIEILDMDEDGVISLSDFLTILDVVKISIKQASSTKLHDLNDEPSTLTCLDQRLPFNVKVPLCVAGLLARVNYKYVDVFIDFVVASLIILHIMLNTNNVKGYAKISASIFIFIILLMISEMVFKLSTLGWKAYRLRWRNKIDGSITVLLIILTIIGAALTDARMNTIVTRVVIMIRVLLFPRNLHTVFPSYGFKNVTRSLRGIVRSIYILGEVFLCMFFAFSSIGILLFGGTIAKISECTANYDAINYSPFGQNGFWALNFNDFPSAFVLLFACLHVSDFDVIASGFAAGTSDGALVYFSVWFAVGVLFMLNILKSFFLNGFVVASSDEATLSIQQLAFKLTISSSNIESQSHKASPPPR